MWGEDYLSHHSGMLAQVIKTKQHSVATFSPWNMLRWEIA